jgi:hypothetical protein
VANNLSNFPFSLEGIIVYWRRCENVRSKGADFQPRHLTALANAFDLAIDRPVLGVDIGIARFWRIRHGRCA